MSLMSMFYLHALLLSSCVLRLRLEYEVKAVAMQTASGALSTTKGGMEFCELVLFCELHFVVLFGVIYVAYTVQPIKFSDFLNDDKL